MKVKRMTKQTLQLLEKHGDSTDHKHYIQRVGLIADMLLKCEAIHKNTSGGFENYKPETENHQGYTSVIYGYSECGLVRGMCARYPSMISMTLFHGLNEVHIINPDKLVYKIVREYA